MDLTSKMILLLHCPPKFGAPFLPCWTKSGQTLDLLVQSLSKVKWLEQCLDNHCILLGQCMDIPCTWTDIRLTFDRDWTEIGFRVQCLSDHTLERSTKSWPYIRKKRWPYIRLLQLSDAEITGGLDHIHYKCFCCLSCPSHLIWRFNPKFNACGQNQHDLKLRPAAELTSFFQFTE